MKYFTDKTKTKIYLVTDCYGDPNKVYIGKTIDPVRRKRDHQKSYGKDIIYTVIDKVQSIFKQDWEPLETYWIQQFMVWGFEVINKKKAGGSGSEGGHKMPPGFGERHSKFLKGRKAPWIVKGRNGMTKTPILQYDKQNNFIKEWPSQKQAANELNLDTGTLTTCLKGRQKTCGGFIWRYK